MRPALGVVGFLLLFAALVFLYIRAEDSSDVRKFENHAAIIADDIWALNQPSARTYLLLALQRDYYKSLTVIEPGDREFLTLSNTPLTGIDRVLYSFNLIGVKPMKTTIQYNNRAIGELLGEQYVRVIYPLVNCFIFLVALVLAMLLVGRLFRNHRQLEQQVRERTMNLIESERRFHDLVNLLPEMVWETDGAGLVSYANQMAKVRLGMDSDSANSSWFSAIIAEQQEQARQYFHDITRGKFLGLMEFTARDTRGKSFPVLVRSAPIRTNDTITGARCVAIDITERHDLEEQLRRAQRMKAIGLMAGGVAHDLNNILSGIVTYPELLLMDLPADSSLRHGIETIRRSGLAAANVVSDLLTVARGVAAARETADFNQLVKEYLSSPEALNLRSLHPAVEVDLDLDEEAGKIICSPVHIRKCLMNLVTNGAEAIQGRGRVVIATGKRHISAQDGALYELEAGSYAVMRVSDTGPGIAKEDLNHIFEPFYTKKVMGRSGTGLGLTVVWNSVREHDGAVKVISGPGGTTFELMFPLAANDEATLVPGEKDWRALCGAGEHILVVDDEAQQRDIAIKILHALNYSVAAVDSGENALDYLREHTADLLILDMLMEPGPNGRQTFAEVLKIHPGQKAILVSGYSESEDVMETLAMGAGAFVHKPYTLVQLGQAIYRELNGVECVGVMQS